MNVVKDKTMMRCLLCFHLCLFASVKAFVVGNHTLSRRDNVAQLECYFQNQIFTCPVELPMSPITFEMIVDLGSPVTWVATHFTASPTYTGPLYDPVSRILRRPQKVELQVFNEKYESGSSVSGWVVRDGLNFRAGGDLITLTNVCYGAASQIRGGLGSLNVGGLLGLGFQSGPYMYNDLRNYPSILEELLMPGVMQLPLFWIDESTASHFGVTIGLGTSAVNDRIVDGKAVKAQAQIVDGHWAFQKVKVWSQDQGETTTNFLGDANPVYIDSSGQSFFEIGIVHQFYSRMDPAVVRIRPDGRYEVRCDARPPDFVLGLDGTSVNSAGTNNQRPDYHLTPVITIPGEDLIVRYADSSSTGWCLGHLQQNWRSDRNILGERLYRALFVEFSAEFGSSGRSYYITLGPHSNPKTPAQQDVDKSLQSIRFDTDLDNAELILLTTNDDEPYPSDAPQQPETTTTATPTGLGSPSTSTSSSSSSSSASSFSSSSSTSFSSSSSSSTPTSGPDNSHDQDVDQLATAHGIDLGALGLASSDSLGIAASIVSGIIAASSALGLGIGLGVSHINYGADTSMSGLTYNYTVNGTHEAAAMSIGLLVENNTFSQLFDDIQSDFDRGFGPSKSGNYSGSNGDINFRYNIAEKYADDGVAAFNSTLGFIQWSRLDGLHNQFSALVQYAQGDKCTIANMVVFNNSGHGDYEPAFIGNC